MGEFRNQRDGFCASLMIGRQDGTGLCNDLRDIERKKRGIYIFKRNYKQDQSIQVKLEDNEQEIYFGETECLEIKIWSKKVSLEIQKQILQ